MVSFNSLTALFTLSTCSGFILSFKSCWVSFSAVYVKLSASFFTSASSFFFLSCSANCSDSFFSLSISSLESLVFAEIVILDSFEVARSFAVTFRMPFASISKVTSTCGIPLGAGGIPDKLNIPKETQSDAIDLSP